MKKKNRLLIFLLLMLGTPCLAIAVFAACATGKTYIERYRNCFVYHENDDTFQKIAVFTLNTIEGSLQYSTWGKGVGCVASRDHNQPLCWPKFETEQWYDVEHNVARFKQNIYDAVDCQNGQPTYAINPTIFDQDIYCGSPTPTPTSTASPTSTPVADACTTPQWADGSCPPGTSPNLYGMCCTGGGSTDPCGDTPAFVQCGTIVPETACSYIISGFGSCYSPVLIDVAGDGFRLTNAESGVPFDLDGNPDGMTEQVSWTTPGSDDAWLVLDRNGNGVVDSGRELFGNLTIQPATAAGNGFLALAQYDAVKNGGNADGVIDNHDGFFPLLRLWQDRNHNGLSEAEELQTLSALGVTMLHVDYKESKRVDEYGNEFRYRAKVGVAKSAQGGRWAWDVFLVKEQ